MDEEQIATRLVVLRQQVNQRCRRFEEFGVVTRRSVNGKIPNFLNARALTILSEPKVNSAPVERRWFWEGNVQTAVARHPEKHGYTIVSEADTASKQQGKDIVAVDSEGMTLWVSAKGCPGETVQTDPRNQARHWFAHALSDLILWHGDDPSKQLVLALPEQPAYRRLAGRATWLFSHLNVCIHWVREDGGRVRKVECGSNL